MYIQLLQKLDHESLQGRMFLNVKDISSFGLVSKERIFVVMFIVDSNQCFGDWHKQCSTYHWKKCWLKNVFFFNVYDRLTCLFM